jgi:hypothetical protein
MFCLRRFEAQASFTAALQETSVKEKLSVQGLFPTLACGKDFAYLSKQNDAYSRIIAEGQYQGRVDCALSR